MRYSTAVSRAEPSQRPDDGHGHIPTPYVSPSISLKPTPERQCPGLLTRGHVKGRGVRCRPLGVHACSAASPAVGMGLMLASAREIVGLPDAPWLTLSNVRNAAVHFQSTAIRPACKPRPAEM